MKRRKVLFSVSLFFLFLNTYLVEANTYYISNSGNDENSGLTESQAFRSIERLNALILLPGDSILFKCGDLFRGELKISQSGSDQKPIIIGSYGSGPMPVLSGSYRESDWSHEGNNIFSARCNRNIYQVFNGNSFAPLARYPNSGYLYSEMALGRIGLVDRKLIQPDGFWDGARIRMRTIQWAYETRRVKSFVDHKLYFQKDPMYPIDIQMYEFTGQVGDSIEYKMKKGQGYYLEDKFEILDTLNEWYFDKKRDKIFIYSEEEPIGFDLSSYLTAIKLASGISNVIIQGLNIRKFAQYGIHVGSKVKNILILNNRIEYIDVAGIYFQPQSAHSTIRGNIIHHIRGRGISLDASSNAQIFDNSISQIGLYPGQGWNATNGANGISINNKSIGGVKYILAHHNIIKNNRLDSCGYIGIRIDGHHNLVEKNVVKYSMLTLNDGGAIYMWGRDTNSTYQNIIRNNIIDVCIGSEQGFPPSFFAVKGVYIDNRVRDNLIENNLILSAGITGIRVNGGASNNTIRGNIIFDTQHAISFGEAPNKYGYSTFGNKFENNQVICKDKDARIINLNNFETDFFNVGTFTNNLYYFNNPYDDFCIEILSTYNKKRIIEILSFEEWQNRGFDQGSKYFSKKRNQIKGEPLIFYNDTNKTKKYTLDKLYNYTKLSGAVLEGSISLEPWQYILLFRK